MTVTNVTPTKTERARLRELSGAGGAVFFALLVGPTAADLIDWGGARKARRLLEACWREVKDDTHVPDDVDADIREAIERGEEWTKAPNAFRPPPYDASEVLVWGDDCWAARQWPR
jgi:hypothetical protein